MSTWDGLTFAQQLPKWHRFILGNFSMLFLANFSIDKLPKINLCRLDKLREHIANNADGELCDPIIIKIDYEYNLVLQTDAVLNNVKTMCLNSAFTTLYIHVDIHCIIKIKCFIRIFCDASSQCNCELE